MEKFEIKRSARRTVSLEITAEGEVLVRAPQRMSYNDICAFVEKHSDWIRSKKAEIKKKPVSAKPAPDALKAYTEKIVFPLVDKWAGIMGLRPSAVKVTGANTRYGSCSPKNALCFSTMLAYCDERAVEYVVVHEIAHIKHKNHGKDFYALIERYLSDYREREKLLKTARKELWDVYDINGNKTGGLCVRDEPMPEGGYHIVIRVCLFGNDGRMLIQRRVDNKKIFPGYWDFSLCGSALAGESSADAAKRETREELGLDIDFVSPVLRMRASHYFDDLFIARCDCDPSKLSLQEEEVAEARYASKEEILAMLDAGMFTPYKRELVDLVFDLNEKLGPFEIV